MKKTISIFLIAGSSLFACSAGAQKLAHVNLDSLLRSMPETDSARKVGQAHYMDLESEVENMNKEYQAKLEDYKAHAAGMTELVKESREKDLTDIGQRIQAFQANAQQDIQKFQDSLTRPIINKARQAINRVAKAKGYEYVLDSSPTGSVLFSNGDDIYNAVAEELGIKPKKPGSK